MATANPLFRRPSRNPSAIRSIPGRDFNPVLFPPLIPPCSQRDVRREKARHEDSEAMTDGANAIMNIGMKTTNAKPISGEITSGAITPDRATRAIKTPEIFLKATKNGLETNAPARTLIFSILFHSSFVNSN